MTVSSDTPEADGAGSRKDATGGGETGRYSLIREGESRRTLTPNALATTLASPGQGGSGLVVWRMDMAPGAAGPEHAYDTEQVLTVLDGQATVLIDEAPQPVGRGDTVVLPAGVRRPALARAASAARARSPTRSAADGRSVMRSMAWPAHTGRGGVSPESMASR
jgi:quercetin dioxygenase-like cupin family protein